MDFITQLPEHILHDILYLLPPKDSVRTCVLSKAWNQIQSRAPFLRFYGNCFSSPTSMLSYAEKHLERYFRNRNDNTPILSFTFCPSINDNENGYHNYNNCVTSLLNRVMKYGQTQLLDLTIWKYKLPHFVLQSDTLTSLCLSGSKCVAPEKVHLPKLTTLFLSAVRVDDEFVERVTRGCPFLQHLKIESCPMLTTLEVTCLERLETVSLEYCCALNKVEIQSPNLHSFQYDVGYSFVKKLCDDLVFSPPKKLTLKNIKIKNSWLQQQLSTCEELTLEYIDFVNDSINISSQKLRELEIRYSHMKDVTRINCPNLQSLEYLQNDFPYSLCN